VIREISGIKIERVVDKETGRISLQLGAE